MSHSNSVVLIVALASCLTLSFVTGQISSSTGSGSLSLRSGLGEPCNLTSNMRCNKSQWLSCQNGTCACVKTDEMVFDSWKEKCVSKAGERCKFEIDESDTALRVVEKAECVTNGECGADGTCVCKATYYEALNGTCLERKGQGQECGASAECRGYIFLICMSPAAENGTTICDCDPSLSKYSAIHGQCVGLVGQECLNGRCVNNSTCNKLANICNCSPEADFYEDDEGRCQPRRAYGESCKKDIECRSENASLTCHQGVCGCSPTRTYEKVSFKKQVPNPDYDVNKCRWRNNEGCKRTVDVVEERYECVGLVNETCNHNSNCVPNGRCVDHRCFCVPDYDVTSTGRCGLGHRQPCNSTTERCSDLLVCSQGRCACRHTKHQTYTTVIRREYEGALRERRNEHLLGKCISSISGPCSDASDCIAHAICEVNPQTGNGVCTCGPGFIQSAGGACDLAFGVACDIDIPVVETYYATASTVPWYYWFYQRGCDRVAGLQCRDFTCQCPDESEGYNQKLRKCVGLVGSRCKAPEDPIGPTAAIVCVENAECVYEHPQPTVAGSCQCIEGFEETVTRRCQLKSTMTKATLPSPASPNIPQNITKSP